MPEENSCNLRKIRRIADYQFGAETGKRLFPNNVTIVLSKTTGKIRHVYVDGELLATLKPTDGFFSLTIEGAKRLVGHAKPRRQWVQVQKEAEAFVEKASDVFAKHVVDADPDIRPLEEVIVLNMRNEVIAVGRAVLSGPEMRDYMRGVAVKVRKGRLEKAKKEK